MNDVYTSEIEYKYLVFALLISLEFPVELPFVTRVMGYGKGFVAHLRTDSCTSLHVERHGFNVWYRFDSQEIRKVYTSV